MPSDHQYPLNLGHFFDGDWIEPGSGDRETLPDGTGEVFKFKAKLKFAGSDRSGISGDTQHIENLRSKSSSGIASSLRPRPERFLIPFFDNVKRGASKPSCNPEAASK